MEVFPAFTGDWWSLEKSKIDFSFHDALIVHFSQKWKFFFSIFNY